VYKRQGGWIAQKHEDGEHPVVFWSRKLKDAETRYPVHEREMLAVVEMCKHYQHYLRGNHFTIHTDHASLRWISTQPRLTPRQARWIEALQEFDAEIQYKDGR
jgi:glutathione S-transferase